MNILKWLGRVWVFPIALVIWVFYLLPLWGLGLLKRVRYEQGVAVFCPVLRWGWYKWLWNDWAGHALPYAIVIRSERSFQHELGHTNQWLLFGPLFPLVFLIGLIFWGYINHPLEVNARKYAEKNK
jgi:hypothetical protein